MTKTMNIVIHRKELLFVCLCFTSLQQQGHLETASPFTVPCEGREARNKLHKCISCMSVKYKILLKLQFYYLL